MITRNLLVATCVLILCAIAYAQLPGTLKKDSIQGPDLITDGVLEKDLNNGKLEVAVKNIGQNASKKSLLRIEVTPTDGLKTAVSRDVKALVPGEVVWVPVSFDKPLNLADYCAKADALKQNAEINEKNNERCGKFSGKP